MNKTPQKLLRILNLFIAAMLGLAIIGSLLMIAFSDYLRRFPTGDF
jgi:hypothetical protein